MEDKDKEDDFLLPLPTESHRITQNRTKSHQTQNQSKSLFPTQNQTETLPLPIQRTDPIYDTWRHEQVYSRSKVSVSTPTRVQDSPPKSDDEVTTVTETNSQFGNTLPENESADLDLPIAIRKKPRECTKYPLYPLSHFVSFDRFSPPHKSFLLSLNTITIPRNLSKALSQEEWRNAIEKRWMPWKRTKHGESRNYQRERNQWAANGCSQ